MKLDYFILIAILGSGIGSFLYKYASTAMHPLIVAGISLCTYAVLLPIAFLLTKVETTITVPGVIFTIASSLFLCIGTLGFSYALRNGGEAGVVTSLTALYPALTLVLSCIFLGESLNLKKVIGIAFALVAAFLLGVK